MKLPIPSESGFENVLDFEAARAKASSELRAKMSVEELASAVNTMIAHRAADRLKVFNEAARDQKADRFARMIMRGIAGLSDCHAQGTAGALGWVKRAVADLEKAT